MNLPNYKDLGWPQKAPSGRRKIRLVICGHNAASRFGGRRDGAGERMSLQDLRNTLEG